MCFGKGFLEGQCLNCAVFSNNNKSGSSSCDVCIMNVPYMGVYGIMYKTISSNSAIHCYFLLQMVVRIVNILFLDLKGNRYHVPLCLR